MKSLSRVVWSEGMYLGPQHFQTQSRYFEDSIHFAVEQCWFEPWGLVACKLDDSAIQNGRVAILNCCGIFEDGLLFDMPESDRIPESRDVRGDFSPLNQEMVIVLAVQKRRMGDINCDLEGSSVLARYRAVKRTIRDVNNGSDEKEVRVGEKNIRILVESECDDSYLTLPIARVRRDGAGHLIYDPKFIPPCTKLTAAPQLLALVRRLLEVLGEKQKFFSRSGRASGAFQAGTRQLDVANFWFLHTINGAIAALHHLYTSKRGHPEELFRELSRLAGELCTFSTDSHPGDLPLYDHRNLQGCFDALEAHILRHLEILVPTNVVSIPLSRIQPTFYRGMVNDQRCFGRSTWILGIRSGGSQVNLIQRAPEIVKVCADDWIQKLVKRALPGLILHYLQVPPSAISPKVEFQYFSIDKDTPCWNRMVDTRQIGIYVPDELPSVELELQVVLETRP